MTSRRQQGLEPEYTGLPDTTRRATQIAQAHPEISTNIFSRVNRKRRPESEPIPEITKVTPIAPVAVTETEEVIPLSKKQILSILSREMPMDRASIIETFMRRSNIKNQQVPSIYSSYFFRKDIIKEFQRQVINKVSPDKLGSFCLSTYNLYNKDDILNNTTYRPDVLGSRYIEKTTNYTSESRNNMKEFIEFLSKKICSDINPFYAKRAVQRAIDLIKNENEFDILIASTRIIEDVTLSLTQRLDGVVAFIIVELGECKKYPAAYSINLICTDTKKAISGTGSVLMGAFLYTILSHPNNTNPSDSITFPNGNGYLKVTSKRLPDGRVIENCTFTSNESLIPVQHIAVLELANAYNNAGGLCMYEKFGFTYDQTMFTDTTKNINCFEDRNNLPMIIDFINKPGYSELNNDNKKQKIIEITAGINRGFEKSKICSLRGDYQRLLGYLKTMKLYIDNTPGATLDSFYSGSIEEALVNEIKLRYRSLDQLIDYLENPPQPDNRHMNKLNNRYMKSTIDKLITILPIITSTGGSKKNRKISRRYTKKRF